VEFKAVHVGEEHVRALETRTGFPAFELGGLEKVHIDWQTPWMACNLTKMAA
jgi:hypothetical protein